MSEDIVKIKGIKHGLLLIFASNALFTDIEDNIKNKLISGFFLRGTHVYLKPNTISDEKAESLRKLFLRYGLIFKIEDPETEVKEVRARVPRAIVEEEKPKSSEKVETKAESKTESKTDGELSEMLVVEKTLRGGQEVRTKSSVLVCGNVNPGAQVIAGGSIDVRGKCLGMVHAGAYGNKSAVIIADYLAPTQIRIANLVARAPDEGDSSSKAERASIKDGQIVIEPIER